MPTHDPRGAADTGAQPRAEHAVPAGPASGDPVPGAGGAVAAGATPPEGDASERRRTWRAVDEGTSMSVRLIGGILTWAGIGWLLDQWLGTDPWLFAAGAVIGNAGGLYLMWLHSGRGADGPQEGSEVAGD